VAGSSGDGNEFSGSLKCKKILESEACQERGFME
jgi:hypothetical protein